MDHSPICMCWSSIRLWLPATSTGYTSEQMCDGAEGRMAKARLHTAYLPMLLYLLTTVYCGGLLSTLESAKGSGVSTHSSGLRLSGRCRRWACRKRRCVYLCSNTPALEQ